MQKHKGRKWKNEDNSGTSMLNYAKNAKPWTFNVHLLSLVHYVGQFTPSTKKTIPNKFQIYQGSKETPAVVKFGSVKASLASQFLMDRDACCTSGVGQEIDQQRFSSPHSFELHGTSDLHSAKTFLEIWSRYLVQLKFDWLLEQIWGRESFWPQIQSEREILGKEQYMFRFMLIVWENFCPCKSLKCSEEGCSTWLLPKLHFLGHYLWGSTVIWMPAIAILCW